jgi:hypothetical protein
MLKAIICLFLVSNFQYVVLSIPTFEILIVKTDIDNLNLTASNNTSNIWGRLDGQLQKEKESGVLLAECKIENDKCIKFTNSLHDQLDEMELNLDYCEFDKENLVNMNKSIFSNLIRNFALLEKQMQDENKKCQSEKDILQSEKAILEKNITKSKSNIDEALKRIDQVKKQIKSQQEMGIQLTECKKRLTIDSQIELFPNDTMTKRYLQCAREKHDCITMCQMRNN